MSIYSCLIVEDEPSAADILHDYIKTVPFLALKGICKDAFEAMELLSKEKIDLIFLDINLPTLNGIELLRALKHPPQVIITTAYTEYAMEGYSYGIMDYLIKPIEFKRFFQAVRRLQSTEKIYVSPQPVGTTEHLVIKVTKKVFRIPLNQILYIESLKEFIRVVTVNGQTVTRVPLKEIENLLLSDHFIRTHRSFIVAKARVTAYTSTEIELGDNVVIPIGRSYKESVYRTLEC